jgi:diaminohydroxyphosphoribosylaminopyrimidine deaminase/5-amino-6-(5-phosphoribosylamino)uracil reductase
MDDFVRYMEIAIRYGRLSLPLAGTNPAVGALIVQNGEVVASGYHRGPGTSHAEIDAVNNAEAQTISVRGADLYCTLEPCCHEGGSKRTPPCTAAIIAAGFARVIIGCRDPNPLVAGKGVAKLRAAGITVIEDVLSNEANSLIEPFTVSIAKHRPFVRLKWAQSLDGRIACTSGASKWISGTDALRAAHELRATHDAILVGAGTVVLDDPSLTVRHVEGRSPLRLILAGSRPLPAESQLLSGDLVKHTWLVAVPGSPAIRQAQAKGLKILEIPAADGRVDLAAALTRLYQEGIGSILVEGGNAVLTAFWNAGLWDAASIFCAPIMIGEGLGPLGNIGINTPGEAVRLGHLRYIPMADHLRVEVRKELPCLPV